MSESKSERLERALGSLESLISDPPRSNKDSDAERFEKLLRKAKPKAKSVCALNGDKIPIVIHGRPVHLKANEEEIEDSFLIT
jgi:fructose-1-phosphate kinase PfkB-like protein